jgi:hypothetical protein
LKFYLEAILISFGTYQCFEPEILVICWLLNLIVLRIIAALRLNKMTSEVASTLITIFLAAADDEEVKW